MGFEAHEAGKFVLFCVPCTTKGVVDDGLVSTPAADEPGR
jgi:hypothetical protein